MRLICAFEMVEMDDTIVAVPVGDKAKDVHGVLKINKECQEILEMLSMETTETEIVERLSNKYENSQAVLREYVHNTVECLRNNHLILE